MSIRFTSEAAGLEARTAVKGEDTAASNMAERGTLRGRVQSDFNPLMERVMRAQKLAEGRQYRTSTND